MMHPFSLRAVLQTIAILVAAMAVSWGVLRLLEVVFS